jgi:hypothetical protein
MKLFSSGNDEFEVDTLADEGLASFDDLEAVGFFGGKAEVGEVGNLHGKYLRIKNYESGIRG